MTSLDPKKLPPKGMTEVDRLAACTGHNFQPITPGLFGTKYVCTNCQVEVDGLSAKWYAYGRRDGVKYGEYPHD